MKNNHEFTKKEIRTVIELWNENSTDNIAERLGISKNQVVYLAGHIRKAGYKLPRKTIIGRTQSLIKEVINEL